MKTLILGAGEIGKALYDVLAPFHETKLADVNPPPAEGIEILHICFPWSPTFIEDVKRYRDLYRPRLLVVHATVPVGTCRELAATHSPIRGNHAEMALSIKAFIKFVGGKDADEVADYFHRAGMRTMISRKSETTELGKLACTTFYGWLIEYAKAVEEKCEEENVPFAEAWTLFQQTYNEGYELVGHPEFRRPILAPIRRKIGGHCVVPNLDLVKDFWPADVLRERTK